MSISWLAVLDDGTATIEFAPATISARIRASGDSYASITSPFLSAVVDFLEAAPGTVELTLTRFDGEDSDELITVDVDYFRYDVGATRASLTISGHIADWDYGQTPVAHTLNSVNYYTSGGTYRIPFDPAIKTGDSVEGAAGSYTIGLLTLQVSVNGEILEVSE